MSTNTNESPFASIDPTKLQTVSGGTSSSDQQLQLMLTQLTSSISQLNQPKDDGMQMMLMMMLMMGGGGGGGVVAAPPAYGGGYGYAQPVLDVSASGLGGYGGGGWCGGGRCGGCKKGW
jgi:hypothetical protein